MPKILFLDSTEYEMLKAKLGEVAAENATFERDEFGYFDHVYHVGFPTGKSQVIKLNSRHTIIEQSKDRFKIFQKIKIIFNLLNSLVFLLKIRALIKREGINLIRAIDAREQAIFACLLSISLGIPWCISVHSDYDKRRSLDSDIFSLFGSGKIAKKIERFTLSKAPLVMVIRESLKDSVIESGARVDLVRVIPHGVDFSFLSEEASKNIHIRDKYNIENDKPIVSFAARMRNENYVYDVIKIAEYVCKKRNDVIFLMAGEGQEKENLERIIKKGDLSENIKLLGFISRGEVLALRMTSDVNLCLMAGYSLLEAAISGKPVIAYDVEWHNELIVNNQTGILNKERDIEGVGKSILSLLDDPLSGQKMADKAKDCVFEKHSMSYTSSIKVKYYEELLSRYKKTKRF